MPECGSLTSSGSLCKRRVREGEHCCFHRENPEGEQCSVCLTNLVGNCKTLPCNHIFHTRCISEWKNRGKYTCPICRAPFMEPPPYYRITILVENLTAQTSNSNVFTSNSYPDMLRQLDIMSPNAILTEVVLEVDSNDSLNEVLEDLGIQNPRDLF